MSKGQAVRYVPNKGQIALGLALLSSLVLLVVAGIKLLPVLTPGLRYLYAPGTTTGPLPAVLVNLPLPIAGWLATALVFAPWVACLLPLLSLALLSRARTEAQILTVHKPGSLVVSERRLLSRRLATTYLIILPILNLIAGGASGNMAWAVADNHFNNFGGDQTTLRRVVMVSATEGWAVGGIETSSSTHFGVVWHYLQGKWARVPLTVTRAELYDLTALPNGDAWAVGASMTILHEHQGTWTLEPLPQGLSKLAYGFDSLFGITMISPTEGWAVGGWGPENEQSTLAASPGHEPGCGRSRLPPLHSWKLASHP